MGMSTKVSSASSTAMTTSAKVFATSTVVSVRDESMTAITQPPRHPSTPAQ
jgi:hypothetical protein